MNMRFQRILIAVFVSTLFGGAAFAARAENASPDTAPATAEQHQPAGKHKGAKRWQEMTPEQRTQAREHFQRFRQLPPEEQTRIRDRYQHFKKLPPEQRKELREQWEKMSPEERKALRKKRSEHRMQQDRKLPPAQP
ncbi:MAG: DUF3106 domain-containing protein [Gammaproteobacteria bacterium]|nr:DUF3106 domain-containing protein [Gammaproteobacteria bacterium]